MGHKISYIFEIFSVCVCILNNFMACTGACDAAQKSNATGKKEAEYYKYLYSPQNFICI